MSRLTLREMTARLVEGIVDNPRALLRISSAAMKAAIDTEPKLGDILNRARKRPARVGKTVSSARERQSIISSRSATETNVSEIARIFLNRSSVILLIISIAILFGACSNAGATVNSCESYGIIYLGSSYDSASKTTIWTAPLIVDS